MKKITLAESAGFCFGVKRAVDTAMSLKDKESNSVFTLGPLIHNSDVVNTLKENNIRPIEFNEIDNLKIGDTIIIRSHGVKPSVKDILINNGFDVIDTTCPYVNNIHKKVAKHYKEGYVIIIVGDKNHPEVIGINGSCNDEAIISKDGSDLKDIEFYNKVCLVSQTTEKQSNWEKVLSIVTKKSKKLVAFNTICNATEVRQKAATELSKHVDAMVVIGGKNSSNTTKLYEICKENCDNTYHIENAKELPEKLKNFNNIGVTAGASTPQWIIEEAIRKMNNTDNEMNEQLKYMEENEGKIFVGKVIKGEIISINSKEAYVDLNYKSDGVLPLNEVTSDENSNLIDIFNQGDIIEAKVIQVKNSDGNVVLSRIEFEREEGYKILEDSFKNKSKITVKIKEEVKGGLVGKFKGIKVFLPASQIELNYVEDLSKFIGKDIEVQVIELNKEKRNTKVVVSRKIILEQDKKNREENAWDSIEKDTIVNGIIRRINDFGAFVEVNGIDGLLHISEISWGKVEKISDNLKIGEEIKVYVLDVDKTNKKLSLSLKKLVQNPWNNVQEKYPIGNIVLGKVVRFADFGAFIELEPGVDALLHVSQISHNRIEKPEDVLKIGENIKAKILEVNDKAKRISLSTKELMDI